MEGLGTAYFGERSSSAGGILSKNNMKRRDGFQFITPERNQNTFWAVCSAPAELTAAGHCGRERHTAKHIFLGTG